MRFGRCRFGNVCSVQIGGGGRWSLVVVGGCRLSVVGRWSLVVGRWSLVVVGGCRWWWSLVVVGGGGCRLSVVGRWSLVVGRWSLVVGGWSVMWQFAPMRLLEYVAGRQKAKRR